MIKIEESEEKGMSISALRSIIDYDPETGDLTWKTRPVEMFQSDRIWKSWNTQNSGKKAGYKKGDGYLLLDIFNVTHRLHRVAFAIGNGKWPAGEVDHINMIRSDNRLINLRESTRSQNSMNAPLSKNNSSGVKGVYWNSRRMKWCAAIGLNGSKIHLGYYSSIDEASMAVESARINHHGSFGRHIDVRSMP